jgi:hypothetical protein
MTNQNNFTKIGKITSVSMNKTSESGKTTNHVLEGFVMDPITGIEIGIRIIINTEAKRYDPKLKKFVVDDKAPLKGDITLKGIRKEGSYVAKANTYYEVNEIFPKVTEIFTLNKAEQKQTLNSVKVAKKVIEVDDSSNPF